MDPVIRTLIVADTITYGAVGLLGPIFAIFITDFIQGGTVEVAGVAAAIFLLTRSVLQIPSAAIIDKICGDKDDYWFLLIGTAVVSVIPLLYIFISTPLELYIVQFILGAATAFTYPSYMALFTRYIDKNREATAWGVYFTLTDISSAATAAIGGVLAATVGFEKVIYAVVILSLAATAIYIPMKKSLTHPADCE